MAKDLKKTGRKIAKQRKIKEKKMNLSANFVRNGLFILLNLCLILRLIMLQKYAF